MLQFGLILTHSLLNLCIKISSDLCSCKLIASVLLSYSQEAEVVTSMSFHPTGDFILVGTEHPTSE